MRNLAHVVVGWRPWWRAYLQACQNVRSFDPVRYWVRVTFDDIEHRRQQLVAARTETEWPHL